MGNRIAPAALALAFVVAALAGCYPPHVLTFGHIVLAVSEGGNDESRMRPAADGCEEA